MKENASTSTARGSCGIERRGLFESLFESLSTGVLLVEPDLSLSLVNRALERAAEVTPEQSLLWRCGPECAKACRLATSSELSRMLCECPLRESCLIPAAIDLAREVFAEGRSQIQRVVLEAPSGSGEGAVELVLEGILVTIEGRSQVAVLIDDLGPLIGAHRSVGDVASERIVGRHPRMLQIFKTIRQVAPLDVPVVIEGESGTGKELVAEAIHHASSRASGRLVPVNCGALVESLLESELFGHVKGAFSGAARDRKGRFELADGGTLFFDEVGELAPSTQVGLLRVLQDGAFERVGSEKTMKVDVRVVCATNRSLEEDVAHGSFRADLYYRLRVVEITLPPLRQRRSDIPLLAEELLARAERELGTADTALSEGALDRLMRHPWPGNVRELDNCLRYALTRSEGGPIQPEHLPLGRFEETAAAPLRRSRRKLNSTSVREALRRTDNNRSQAAQLLGVSRATLYRFLAESESRTPLR